MEVWTCGGVDVWRCGHVDMWTCGRVKVWRCGGVEVWRCGGVEYSDMSGSAIPSVIVVDKAMTSSGHAASRLSTS